MQERFKRYFWDGGADFCSGPYRLRRVIEYASFPDLLMYPFEEVKEYLPQIVIQHLRTSQNRIEFMQLVKEKAGLADTWDEIFFS
ncbi:MAG: hypothetical protein ACYDH8_04900 [Syntrophales bacterium]